MMQITVDPTTLSQEQREAVAGFLLAFPRIGDTPYEDMTFIEGDGKLAPLVFHATPAPVPTPPVQDEALSPGEAFGGAVVHPAPPAQAPAAAFGQPPAPVPTAPAMGTAAVALDKNGLPWDARIHSSNKATVADGSWRMKRGVTPELIASVEAELRGVMAAPAPAPAMAAPAPAPAMAAPTPAPADNPVAAYVALLGRASAAIQAGKLVQAEITAACARAGVPALPLLANRPDLVPQVAAEIDAIVAGRP